MFNEEMASLSLSFFPMGNGERNHLSIDDEVTETSLKFTILTYHAVLLKICDTFRQRTTHSLTQLNTTMNKRILNRVSFGTHLCGAGQTVRRFGRYPCDIFIWLRQRKFKKILSCHVWTIVRNFFFFSSSEFENLRCVFYWQVLLFRFNAYSGLRMQNVIAVVTRGYEV